MKLLTNTRLLIVVIMVAFWGCKNTQNLTDANVDDGIIEFNFFQVNDVYEIAPLEGGKVGGMARVAAKYQEIKADNPNTLFVMAGDFLNPSLIGTLKYEGKRIKGRQMVEAMNTAGVHLAAFGNHEFDVKEQELQERINESNFEWIATNLIHKKETGNTPFQKIKDGNTTDIPKTFTWKIKDADGTEMSIGFFSATINSNPKPFVIYEDFMTNATNAYQDLKSTTDMVIGLTHLSISEDMQLAAKVPDVPLIMGGHEHHKIVERVGNVMITKADANAKSAWLHTLTYNKKTGKHTLKSKFIPITDDIKSDPATQKVVDFWGKVQEDNIKTIYADPYEIIYNAKTPLDGRESSIRSKQTNMGEMFTAGFAFAAKQKAVAAIMNSGSVRIDDQLSGDVQAIDIFRALPFGGEVYEVDVKGDMFTKILDEGLVVNGAGSFLQIYNIEPTGQPSAYKVDGKLIDPNATYHIAVNDYLFTHNQYLKNLTPTKPAEGDKSDIRSDLRVAIIEYMKTL